MSAYELATTLGYTLCHVCKDYASQKVRLYVAYKVTIDLCAKCAQDLAVKLLDAADRIP